MVFIYFGLAIVISTLSVLVVLVKGFQELMVPVKLAREAKAAKLAEEGKAEEK